MSHFLDNPRTADMKILLVLCLVVAAVSVEAQNTYDRRALDILPPSSRSEVRDEANQYSLSYQAANGISVASQGELKPTAEGDYVLEQKGIFSFYGDDGRFYETKYVADKDGYRATGDHLPVSPPLPNA